MDLAGNHCNITVFKGQEVQIMHTQSDIIAEIATSCIMTLYSNVSLDY